MAQAGSQSAGQPASLWSEPAIVTDSGSGEATTVDAGASTDATRAAAITVARKRRVRDVMVEELSLILGARVRRRHGTTVGIAWEVLRGLGLGPGESRRQLRTPGDVEPRVR